MAQLSRAQLKALWITGYVPTQTDYENLFDSMYDFLSDNLAGQGNTLVHAGLSGSYTNSGLTKPLIEVEIFLNNPQLITVNMPANTVIQTIDFENGTTAVQNLDCSGCSALKQLFLQPIITSVIDVDLSGCVMLTSLTMDSALSMTDISLANCTSLTDLSVDGCSSAVVIDVSGLAALINANLYMNSLVTAYDFSSSNLLQNVNGNDCSALTTVTISSTAPVTACTFNTCALNVGSVDGILAALNANGQINGTCDLAGGINASPTGGANNADYLALIVKGWTVNIN